MTDPFQIPEAIAAELADAVAGPMRKLFAAWSDQLAAHEAAVAVVEGMDGWDWSKPLFGNDGPADVLFNLAEMRTHTEALANVEPTGKLRQALDTADGQAASTAQARQERLDAMSDAELMAEARRLAIEP